MDFATIAAGVFLGFGWMAFFVSLIWRQRGSFIEPVVVDRLRALSTAPGDVVVVEMKKTLSVAAAERFRQDFERFVPGTKCILLEDGVRLAGVLQLQVQSNSTNLDDFKNELEQVEHLQRIMAASSKKPILDTGASQRR